MVWAALGVLLVICWRWLAACGGAGQCKLSVAGPNDWLSLTIAAITALGILTGAALVGRTSWLIVASAVELRRLPITSPPDHVRATATSVGIRRLRFLPLRGEAVFCAGALRPAVYISKGVCDRLQMEELAAVLMHEAEHASSYDPARRAVWRAASEVFFFMPLLSWLRERRIECSELRADRRAIDALGPKPVASALWSLGTAALSPTGVAFSGTIDIRTAQLLGDPLPRRLPGASVVALTVGGFAFALAVMTCVVQVGSRLAQ